VSSTMLNVAQVATLLGLGKQTVRRLSEDGVIPCTRTFGGHRRYDPQVVRNLLVDEGDVADFDRRTLVVALDRINQEIRYGDWTEAQKAALRSACEWIDEAQKESHDG